MTDDLTEALVDVRRAYRLLWAYQRRVNDLLHAIDEHLGHHGLRQAGWKPASFLNVPNSAFYNPKRWAWDMFPGHSVQAWWTGTTVRGPMRADVWLYTDDGFQVSRGEPDPATWDVSPERARSKLWLYIATGPGAPDWDGLHALTKSTNFGETGTFSLPSGDYQVLCLLAGLEELRDPDALHGRLLARVDRWCAEVGALRRSGP